MTDRHSTFFVILAMLLFFSGCAGSVKNMQPVPEDLAVTEPEDGKALLIFMRPSGIGFAIQSSVFSIVDDKPHLVGIVAAKKKVYYQTDPGQHLYMVVGESGDFMSAELLANKTYYALITPRMGVWKARFSLKPVHKNELDSEEFTNWLNGCQWVKTTDESVEWARSNMNSIQQKYDTYYPKWKAKNDMDKPALLPLDGM